MALDKVKIPAAALQILSMVSIILLVVGICVNLIVHILNGDFSGLYQNISMSAASLFVNILVFRGAGKMRNLTSYNDAQLAAVMALIPCCGPVVILGIPFGIWSLVVLNQLEVSAEFYRTPNRIAD